MKKTILGKEIDLSSYENRWSEDEIKSKLTDGSKFVKFVWIDLNKKNSDDDEFTNAGVRSEQNTEDSVANMQFSIVKNGWNDLDFPPVVDTEEEFEELDRLNMYDQLLNTVGRGVQCDNCGRREAELYEKYYPRNLES